jgi:Fe-S cluster biogenesis protein NfuA
MPDNTQLFDDSTVIEKIQEIIEQMRPAVQSHEGDIEFISYLEGTVSLKFHGACVGCPFSFYTLKMGIEQKIKEQVPTVQQVVAVD